MSFGMFQVSLFGSSGGFIQSRPLSSSEDTRRKERLLEKKIRIAEDGYNPREIENLQRQKAQLSHA